MLCGSRTPGREAIALDIDAGTFLFAIMPLMAGSKDTGTCVGLTNSGAEGDSFKPLTLLKRIFLFVIGPLMAGSRSAPPNPV